MEKNKYYKKIGIKLAVVLVSLIGIFLVYKLAIFYLPFIIAILVSMCIEPLIKFFMKRLKLKRKFAAIISLLIVIGIVGGIFTFGITKLVVECTHLVANSNDFFTELYDNSMNLLNEIEEGRTFIPKESVEIMKESTGTIIEGLKAVALNIGKSLLSTISSIPTIITYIIITLLAIIFTCIDRQYVINLIETQVPKKWVDKVKSVFSEMCSVTWNYIKAEVKLSFICFIIISIGIAIMDFLGLGVKYPALMAVIIGFVDLLPLFGAGTVMLPWGVYEIFTGNITLGIVIISIWGVWTVLKQFIEPKMVSKQIGMHPILTLIAMYTGFRIYGVLGLMIGPIIFLMITNIFKELLKKGLLKSFFEMD